MSVKVKIAGTTHEVDQVFRLRHRVFVDEECYFERRHDRRIMDRFDAYPTTANLIAAVDGRIVGALRVVEETEAGSPCDEFFDIRPHLQGESRFSSGSMFCVERAYRSTPQLVFALLAMGYHWSRSRGLSRMVGAINPDVEGLFSRVGARRVAPPVWNGEAGLGAIPMLIELDRLPAAFASFVARQRVHAFEDSFERQFLERGQAIRCGRDARRAAYVVLDGQVAVERHGDRVRALGRGDWLDESHLPPTELRGTQIAALSRAELMILDSATFERRTAEARG
jgi:N-acyl-L-homoserine lactone synthetase